MVLKHKNIFILLFIVGSAIIFNSCQKDEEMLTFGEATTYFKIGNSDTLEAPAILDFINGSKNVDSYHWTFPEGKVIENGLVTEKTAYTGIQPEGVLYEEPGNYTATLNTTVNGESNSMELHFDVLKPLPTIFVSPTAIKFLEPVTFSAKLYMYPGKENDVTYSWDFGNGETSIQANPEVIYEVPGNYTVTLTINDTEETLTTSKAIEVKGELAPTLYATDAISGKLYRKKLFNSAPSELKATDLSLGLHPLGVNVYQENLVISEAGDNIKYSAWGTPADGRIIKTNLSGGGMKIITTTDEGGNAYVRDPFSSTVDDEGNVYWVNRFEGVRKLPLASENAAYPDVAIPLLAADIGESSTYGWTDGDVNFVDGEIWYSKHGTGKGLYKYSTDGNFISKIDALSSYKIRSFAVDLENLKIYIAINIASGGVDPGLYVTDIDGNNISLIDEMPDYSTEGGASEMTYVTDMEIDSENGYLYYPYRDRNDIDDSGVVVGDGSNSGVKRYKLDGSLKPEFFIKGIIPYGIGIDKEKR
ncbi:PKD domain-containing protein [Membranihabitans maritimus]|uniref:PKD domain-containing protein n=1 Tax=Membranihabitans maritimus TaxID=2904244 RepID=UPI001F3AD9EF|nr:PKD domain-containing protein [Membranihabitans maritimus]